LGADASRCMSGCARLENPRHYRYVGRVVLRKK
jgi:hypothetical protein